MLFKFLQIFNIDDTSENKLLGVQIDIDWEDRGNENNLT